ncbi:hypothetical protein [Poseidonibacter ostreae]|uniref:Conjugal transfer protein TrbC n=1 Tax=Poseidonibacter ostreae TaxID=2654171 RepID=A0A6L4WRC9_9BACT|nr:hypothetical protein [Poseidonibacter ostreae]KAB7885189.1 hypothetical protein GA417_09155 [Poseidonibacter ostreae]KAB7886080.1 hypothetical protein GBG19_13025 [Poseidonibacter ostreae]KAB7889599.1 hypothetical protein GBG18_10620 [Poseidonibacter ostreae]
MMSWIKRNKMFTAFLAVFVLLAGSSFAAGTGDALGLATTWVKVQGWFADPAVTSIVGMLILIFSIFLFFQKMYISGIVSLVLLVIVVNITTVAASFSGAGIY